MPTNGQFLRLIGAIMSGHSKWATTKHKKAIIDSRRAKNFAKLIKAIEVSARSGGADVSGNPTLFDAIAKAKKNSVPADNIDRAVKRGAGLETGGKEWETIMYEGYAAGGVALLIECLSIVPKFFHYHFWMVFYYYHQCISKLLLIFHSIIPLHIRNIWNI